MSDDLSPSASPHPPSDAEETSPAEAAGPVEATEPEESGASIVLKRNGAETDIVFALHPPSILGRFDPTVGPIDVDLGGLPEGGYVSRKHARITVEDGVWRLEDLGSSNGSFLLTDADFERLEQFELHSGAEFALGNARFVFRLGADERPEPAPA